MAPNLTSNILHFDAPFDVNNGPLDLTCRRRAIDQIVKQVPLLNQYVEGNRKAPQEYKPKGKRFMEQKSFPKRGKSDTPKYTEGSDWESFNVKTEHNSPIDSFSEPGENENLELDNVGRAKKPVLNSKKKRIAVAQKWLNDNVIKSTGPAIAFCAILAAYSQFCIDKNEKRLDDLNFLQLILTKFSDKTEVVGRDGKSSTKLQEYLVHGQTNGTEKKWKNEEEFEKLCKKEFVGYDECSNKATNAFTESVRCVDSSPSTNAFLSEILFNAFTLKCLVEKDYDSSDSGFESNGQVSVRDSSYKNVNFENDSTSANTQENSFAEEKKFNKKNSSPSTKLCIESSDAELDILHFTVKHPSNTFEEQSSKSKAFIKTESGSINKGCSDLQPKTDDDDYAEEKKPRTKETEIYAISNATEYGEDKKWMKTQDKVIANVIDLLQLKGFEISKCYGDARKFGAILVLLLQRNQLHVLLKTFSHSMKCSEKKCSNLCFMFKRIFRHITSMKHLCAVKEMYGHLIRLHLDTCVHSECGIPNCEGLRRMRKGREMKT